MIRVGSLLQEQLRLLAGLHSKRETVMNIYSLFDRKLREYGPLVLANNDASVCRALCDGIPGTQSTIAKYPDDFDLMLLGAFDSDTGQIAPEVIPRLVDNVASILPPGRVTDGA